MAKRRCGSGLDNYSKCIKEAYGQDIVFYIMY